MNEQTYALIRLVFDRLPGQPIDLNAVKAIGPVAMKDWSTLQVELVRTMKTAVSSLPHHADLFW